MSNNQRKNQTLLSGALILVASTIIVKLISAIYKIPITNYIGGIGMGYYTTAYKIYLPIWSISMAGLPIAVSKLISENMALGKYNNVKSIFKVSLRAFIVTGTAGTLLLAAVAYPYVKYVARAPEALPVILCIAPAILICCVMSAYRGYYEGMRNMFPTAISQITESLVKLVFGLGLTYLAIRYCQANGITKPEVRYPIEASAAILGVTFGTLGSQIYLWIKMKKDGFGFTEEELFLAPKADSNKQILRTLINLAIPIVLTSLISNVATLIDAATVQNRLAVAVANGENIIREMYPFIPKGTDKLNVYLYGCFDVDETLRNMVPQITLTLGVSSLPALAQYWAVNDKKNIRISIESVLRICMLISMPAGIGMAVLSQPILTLLYGRSQPDIPFMCKDILAIFGISLFLYALSSPVTTLLQAIGKAKDLTTMRTNMIAWYNQLGVSQDELLKFMNVASVDEITNEMVFELRGLGNAIKEGDTTIEEAIRKPLKERATAETNALAEKAMEEALAKKKQEESESKEESPNPKEGRTLV